LSDLSLGVSNPIPATVERGDLSSRPGGVNDKAEPAASSRSLATPPTIGFASPTGSRAFTLQSPKLFDLDTGRTRVGFAYACYKMRPAMRPPPSQTRSVGMTRSKSCVHAIPGGERGGRYLQRPPPAVNWCRHTPEQRCPRARLAAPGPPTRGCGASRLPRFILVPLHEVTEHHNRSH
jgi:hypothetical protein